MVRHGLDVGQEQTFGSIHYGGSSFYVGKWPSDGLRVEGPVSFFLIKRRTNKVVTGPGEEESDAAVMQIGITHLLLTLLNLKGT
jgi:hypothetical protein